MIKLIKKTEINNLLKAVNLNWTTYIPQRFYDCDVFFETLPNDEARLNDAMNKIVINESHELRLWIFDELKQFAELGGFKIIGIYNQNYERIAENIPINGELGLLFFIMKKNFYPIQNLKPFF